MLSEIIFLKSEIFFHVWPGGHQDLFSVIFGRILKLAMVISGIERTRYLSFERSLNMSFSSISSPPEKKSDMDLKISL